MSNEENNSSLTNLHQAEVDLPDFGKRNLWYVGVKKEFDDLMEETFRMQSYRAALDKGDQTIIDLGAYIGDTAIAFHKYARKIYALEPAKDAYECMLRNVKELELEKVVPINKGLWEYTGKQRLYSSNISETGATLSPFSPYKRGFDIDVLSIDDFFEEYKIDHVDLMKVDIEGSEYEILKSKGFANVADKIDRIIIEAHPFFIPGVAGAAIWAIPQILDKFGFVCKIVNPEVNWNVRVIYGDGHAQWVPMRIFLAEREAK